MNKDIVDEAQEIVTKVKRKITTSQIRRLLSDTNSIKNKLQTMKVKGEIKDDKLSEELKSDIQYLKVRLIYQCGRESQVKMFADTGKLLAKIDAIGDDSRKFMDFADLIEAIVAYHKFEGGR